MPVAVGHEGAARGVQERVRRELGEVGRDDVVAVAVRRARREVDVRPAEVAAGRVVRRGDEGGARVGDRELHAGRAAEPVADEAGGALIATLEQVGVRDVRPRLDAVALTRGRLRDAVLRVVHHVAAVARGDAAGVEHHGGAASRDDLAGCERLVGTGRRASHANHGRRIRVERERRDCGQGKLQRSHVWFPSSAMRAAASVAIRLCCKTDFEPGFTTAAAHRARYGWATVH